MKLGITVAVLLASLAVVAQDAPTFSLKKVADGVYAGINPDGGKAGSDAGFIVGSDGVLVVDSFIGAEPAQQLLAEIRKVTSLPIRYVVNTHYHLDHTGGNAVFAEAGATIIAQKNVRAWERSENLKFFGASPQPEQKQRVESLALPTLVYDNGSLTLFLGSREVRIVYLLGHTGGDSVVFVPDANVVFTGDLFWSHHLPNLIDASTDKWIETLDAMIDRHPAATFVPGHGDIGTVADVRDFRGYLVDLREAVAAVQKQGKSGPALAEAVTTAIQPKYGSWGFYKNFLPRNIDQTAAELSGSKRIPLNSAAK
jgi:glyoxylase-like metal-dependent hydrolase (beta-lactamase superfamily II)